MKIYRKYSRFCFLGILTASIFLGSCGKNFLDAPPILNLPEDVSMDTKARIEAQTVGLYASLKNGNFYAGRYQIYNDIRGDEFINRTNNVVTGFGVYMFTNDPSDTYVANFWIQGYLTINRINKFLHDIELVKEGIITDVEKSEFISEAKFIRALTYYALIQLFAKPYTLDNGASKGIPLRLNPETTIANNSHPSSPVKDIYAQILKDLEDAEKFISAPRAGDYAFTRAHKNTVIALKTRVFLAMANYQQVLVEGKKLVSATAPFQAPSGITHALAPNIVDVFKNYKTAENIFSFPYAANNAPGTQNQLGFYYNAGNIEYYLNTGSTGIFSNPNWPSEDSRKSQLTTLYPNSTWNLLTKWGIAPFLDWVPVIRYAEVLLNVAEAEAEVGDEKRAIALLEAIRHRSNPGYEFKDLSDKQKIIDAILLERRIELLGEGFRAPDLQRRLQPLPAVGTGRTVPFSDNRYTFPIPTDEVLINPQG